MAEQSKKWKPPKEVSDSHKMILEDMGNRLIKLRKDTSASEIARQVGISRNSYRLMERGEIYASMENFLKVLEYHELTPKQFFNLDLDKL